MKKAFITSGPERILWQTVKTQMKCCISSGLALFANTKSIFRERNIIFFKIITCDTSINKMDHPKFTV